jgi:chromosome segregation ATPase
MTLIERLTVLSNADNLTQDQLDTVMAAIRSIEQLRRDMREQDREFQREARDIAAEVRWQAHAERDDVPYGTY